MLILDACVGSEKIYQKRNKLLKDCFIGIDIRKGDFSIPKDNHYLSASEIIVKPTILANMKTLPFKDNIFDVIICDPPHLSSVTERYNRYYTSWSKIETISTIYKANIEFNRILKKNGTLILKILPESINRYESLLNNFIFYLPIQTVRPKGCIKSKEAKLAAIWLIGIKKDNV